MFRALPRHSDIWTTESSVIVALKREKSTFEWMFSKEYILVSRECNGTGENSRAEKKEEETESKGEHEQNEFYSLVRRQQIGVSSLLSVRSVSVVVSVGLLVVLSATASAVRQSKDSNSWLPLLLPLSTTLYFPSLCLLVPGSTCLYLPPAA